jgi:hypothetical protein
MSWMFSHSQFNQEIGNWDISNVVDMSWMFEDSPFNQPIGSWDTSNLTQMDDMFLNSPFTGDISKWRDDLLNDKSKEYLDNYKDTVMIIEEPDLIEIMEVPEDDLGDMF